MKHRLVPILTLLFVQPALAQQQVDVERYVREHQAAIVREFMELVAIPNVRTDLPNIKRNAEQLRQMLERRGMKPEVWDTPSTPMVYGRGAPGHVADFLSAVLEAPSPQHGLKRIGLFPARLVDRLPS